MSNRETGRDGFQSKFIKDLETRFPGCIILKNDPMHMQGVPDLMVLYNDKWAMLECKKNKDAKHRPNQDFYVELLNRMSYSAFVYPENEEEILNELQQTFGIGK